MPQDEPRPWYFLHIPKTAGTTFRVFLENCFHMDAICPAYEFFQIKPYTDAQLSGFRLFRGHMGYNLVNYLPLKPRTLVMLRDPMERAVSHFEYIKRDPGHPKHRIIQERKLGLKEYLLDPVLSAEVTNAQVRPLAHLASRSLLRDLLDGNDSQEDFARAWRHTKDVLPPDDELLDVALQQLESMDFVGIAERLDQGMELAAWLLDVPYHQQMQSLNINPRRTRLKELPTETLSILRQVTALDARLYARGRALFEAQYQRMADGDGGSSPSFGCNAPVGADGSVVVDFNQPLCGHGWHQRELVPGKGIMRWTGPGNYSEIKVQLHPGQSHRMTIHLANWVSDEVLRSLRLYINGQQLPFSLTEREGDTLLLADIPASLPEPDGGPSSIGMQVSHSGIPTSSEDRAIDHSHARKVGVAVYRFVFSPV